MTPVTFVSVKKKKKTTVKKQRLKQIQDHLNFWKAKVVVNPFWYFLSIPAVRSVPSLNIIFVKTSNGVASARRGSLVSLSPPIGSQHKLIAHHSLQECSKLALGNKCEVRLLFQTMQVQLTGDNGLLTLPRRS